MIRFKYTRHKSKISWQSHIEYNPSQRISYMAGGGPTSNVVDNSMVDRYRSIRHEVEQIMDAEKQLCYLEKRYGIWAAQEMLDI